MWKFVAFVFLMIFSVPAVLSEGAVENSTTSAPEVGNITATVESNTQSTVISTSGAPEATTNDSEATINDSEATTNASEITTNASETTVPVTTHVPVTTSEPTTTTVLPPPTVGKYAVKEDENTTCLRVEMALRVSISNPHVLFNFPANASTKGSDCNSTDHTQILKLADPQGHSLTFIFVQENKKNYVQNISFSYSPLEVKTSGHYFSASEGKSYLCNAETSVTMDNVTLTFSSVHIQAFGAQSFGLAEECGADDKVGDIVPIAVGCALGALVIIVLIAYLVGRRRSRQRGYQSV